MGWKDELSRYKQPAQSSWKNDLAGYKASTVVAEPNIPEIPTKFAATPPVRPKPSGAELTSDDMSIAQNKQFRLEMASIEREMVRESSTPEQWWLNRRGLPQEFIGLLKPSLEKPSTAQLSAGIGGFQFPTQVISDDPAAWAKQSRSDNILNKAFEGNLASLPEGHPLKQKVSRIFTLQDQLAKQLGGDEDPQERRYQGFWSELGRMSVAGMMNVAVGGLSTLAEASDDAIFDRAQVEDLADRIYDKSRSPAFQPGKGGGAKGFVAQAIGQAGAYMAAATIATLVTGTPLGGFAVGYSVEGEQAKREALEANATMEQAEMNKFIVGTINGAIEAMQVTGVIKLGKSGSESFRALTSAVRQRAWSKVAKIGKDLTYRQLENALQEAIEEALQETTSIVMQERVAPGEITGQEAVKRIGIAAAAGAVIGPIFGTAGAIVGGGAGAGQAATPPPVAKVPPKKAPVGKELPTPPAVIPPKVAKAQKGVQAPNILQQRNIDALAAVLKAHPEADNPAGTTKIRMANPKGDVFHIFAKDVEEKLANEWTLAEKAPTEAKPTKAQRQHKTAVEQLFKKGKPVRQQYREMYPDLVAKYEGAKGKEPWDEVKTKLVKEKPLGVYDESPVGGQDILVEPIEKAPIIKEVRENEGEQAAQIVKDLLDLEINTIDTHAKPDEIIVQIESSRDVPASAKNLKILNDAGLLWEPKSGMTYVRVPRIKEISDVSEKGKRRVQGREPQQPEKIVQPKAVEPVEGKGPVAGDKGEQVKGKEPWEMREDEWLRVTSETKYFTPAPGSHEQYVRDALSEGKPVPAEVLKDYPDLVKAAPTEAAKEEKGKEYTIGQKTVVEKRYFGDPTTYKWPGNKVVLRDYPDKAIAVYHVKSGWLIEYEKGGVFGSKRKGAGWLGFATKQKAIESYIEQKLQPPAEPAPAAAEAKKPGKPTAIALAAETGKKTLYDKETPPEVQEFLRRKHNLAPLTVTKDTKDAANVMDGYFAEGDDQIAQAKVEGIRLQQRLVATMKSRKFGPKQIQADMAIQVYIDLKNNPEQEKYYSKLTDSQKTLVDLAQNLPAELKAIASDIIKLNNKIGLNALDKGVIGNVIENYSMRLWEDTTRKDRPMFRKFGTKTARAKHRTLEGILHGWSLGKKLKVKGATNAHVLMRIQVATTIVDRQLLKTAKQWGLISDQQLEGWVKIEHPNFTDWKWAGKAEGAKTYGKNFFVTEDGDLMERIPMYAEPGLGKWLNNALGTSRLYDIPGIRTLTEYNAILKRWILFSSFFHHQAYIRSYMLGGKTTLLNISPAKAYRAGRQAIENYTPEFQRGIRNGLTVGLMQDFDEVSRSKISVFGRMLNHVPVAGQLAKGINALRVKNEDWLFGKLGPYLKVQAYLLEYAGGVKKNKKALEAGTITLDDIAATAAKLANDDFGGLHLRRMGRNPTLQHIFRLLALAPDWTESNVRSAVKAFKLGEEGRVYRAFWARIAAKGLLAMLFFNYLMSLFDDEKDFIERYKEAWKNGKMRWMDIDITPLYRAMGGKADKQKYFSLFGHFKDPIKFVAREKFKEPALKDVPDPVRSLLKSAKYKGSVITRIFADGITGKDWKGSEFTTALELFGADDKGVYVTSQKGKYEKGDPKGGKLKGKLTKWSTGGVKPLGLEQVPSFLIYEARAATPIQIQNGIHYMLGQMDGFDAVLKGLGAYVSSTYDPAEEYIAKSKTEQIDALKSYTYVQDQRARPSKPSTWKAHKGDERLVENLNKMIKEQR